MLKMMLQLSGWDEGVAQCVKNLELDLEDKLAGTRIKS